MAALLLLAPLLLLLLGTVAGQTQPEVEGCLWLWNATEGNFSVETMPGTYQANTTYVVTIKDDRNHSTSSGHYLLQALSPQNTSVGRWTAAPTGNCSSLDTAVLKIPENRTLWASPVSSLSSVQIRVYLILPDNTTEFQTSLLNREAESTTLPPSTTLPSNATVPPNSTLPPESTLPPSTAPSSVCRAQSSSLLPAALLLLMGTLLS